MGTVIFDLDGTLADTGGDLVAAANVCFAQMGEGAVLDVSTDAITAMQKGGRAMLALGFERLGQKADIDRWYPVLLEAYAADIASHTRFYDGTLEAVEALRSAGYRTGICTNKPAALAEQLMQEMGARGLFHSLVGADTLPVRKPDPAPLREAVARAGGVMERALLVGDTPTDRETARAAGVPSLLVTFGPAGRDVAALHPEAMIDHYRDLSGVVEGLIGAPVA